MWRTVTLDEVCTLRNGRAYKKPELLSEGKYPVLRVGNFFTSDNWYYSDLELEETKYCAYGDLLYAWSASFGPRIWEGGKVIYHYHIWRVDVDETLVARKFLFYWFEYDKELVKAASGTGTTMMHVSKGSMEKRVLQLPPLAKQQRIVAKLDAVFAEIDRAIETSDSEIEQSNQLFDALVFERFTKSTDDEPVELKELTKELLTGPFGSALHKSDYVEDGIAVINPQNLINGEIIPSDGKFINEQKFGELKRYELRQNDIVIARRGEMGRCALVPVSPHKMICGTGCMILRTNDDCSPDFVAELIQSKYVRNALEQGAIGATMLNLNQGILMGVKVQAKTECQQQENTAYIGYARDITSDYIRLKSEKIEKLLALKSAILAQELQPSEAA